MNANAHETVRLGDLIAAVFDEAARYSTDARKVSRLATHAVLQMLRHAPRTSLRRITANGLRRDCDPC